MDWTDLDKKKTFDESNEKFERKQEVDQQLSDHRADVKAEWHIWSQGKTIKVLSNGKSFTIANRDLAAFGILQLWPIVDRLLACKISYTDLKSVMQDMYNKKKSEALRVLRSRYIEPCEGGELEISETLLYCEFNLDFDKRTLLTKIRSNKIDYETLVSIVDFFIGENSDLMLLQKPSNDSPNSRRYRLHQTIKTSFAYSAINKCVSYIPGKQVSEKVKSALTELKEVYGYNIQYTID